MRKGDDTCPSLSSDGEYSPAVLESSVMVVEDLGAYISHATLVTYRHKLLQAVTPASFLLLHSTKCLLQRHFLLLFPLSISIQSTTHLFQSIFLSYTTHMLKLDDKQTPKPLRANEMVTLTPRCSVDNMPKFGRKETKYVETTYLSAMVVSPYAVRYLLKT